MYVAPMRQVLESFTRSHDQTPVSSVHGTGVRVACCLSGGAWPGVRLVLVRHGREIYVLASACHTSTVLFLCCLALAALESSA